MALNRSLSLLVHGKAKSGKSTIASTSPKPCCYFDIEGGTRFLPINAVVWDPNTEAPPIPDGTWDTAVVKVRVYDDVIKGLAWLQSGSHPFESVVIDSISELQQRLVDKVTNREQAKMQDWGDILRNFMGLMRDFRDLTENSVRPLKSVCLIAMSRSADDNLLHPFAQGQSSTMLPYMFDILGAMHVQAWTDDAGNQQQVHRLLVGANNIYETGERVGGRLAGYLDSPTIPQMLDMVFGPDPAAEAAAEEAATPTS